MSEIMSEIDLENIFKTAPRTTRQVLGAGGGKFYVPIYQRGYNWDSKHIGRLFEDIGRGLRALVENANSITFLGNLIVIDGSTPSDVDRTEVTGGIRIIIDGQQRLTTILLINICLHDEIRRRASRLKIESQPAVQWLYDESDCVGKQLKNTFSENQDRGHGVYKWFPRMIRGNEDRWSSSDRNAKYESPIASFIHNYLKHIQGNDQAKKYTGYANQNEKSSPLVSKYRVIQRKIESVWKGGDENLEIPSLEEVAESDIFKEAIFPAKFPEEVRSILSNEEDENFKRLVRLVLFANFLMRRVAVTVLSVEELDYAFDMFESLNTTGEPLTALETFKPKVVETEGLNEYEESRSRELMRPIEAYLDKFKDAQKKHTETSRLLIPFALGETGYKLSKRHSEQRWYLREQYDRWKNLPEKRHEFLQHMSHTAIFIEDTWKKKNNAFESISFSNDTNRDVVLICMDLLGKVNHEVAIGSLVRFYSRVQLADSDTQKAAAVVELEKAIKAVTAFFTFWRGIGKTTGDLAAQYRELMEKGFDELENQAFCRCPEGKDREPLTNLTANKLQESLRHVLEKETGIKSREDWVTFSFEQPVYKDRKTLTRFMLFAAMHNTSKDPENPVLRAAARGKYLDLLTWEKWKQEKPEQANLEIEHVASQNPEQGNRQSDVYGKPNLIDCLGNLTLLPKAENSSFGNKPWEAKKELYRILASPTLSELEVRLEELQNMGIELSSSTKNLLRSGNYWEHLSAICNVEEWTAKFVRKRSKRLAKLVWTNIAPWLEFDDE